MSKLNIVYMTGGAAYTIFPLQALLSSKIVKLLSIYTNPPRPFGRGKKIKDTAIIEFAKKNKLDYRVPINLKNCEEISLLKKMNIDFIIVFSYGLILPKEIIELPKYKCINIHPSLLPKWRGPSPIQYALLNNEKETGYCFMEMNEGLDTGDILLKSKIDIKKHDNTYTLLNKISAEASLSLEKLIYSILKNKIKKQKQNHSNATYTQKINKKDTLIDFQEEALKILGKIRAFAPNPCARFYIKGEMVKVFEAEVVSDIKNYEKNGVILDQNLLISCGKGAIRLLKVQREGKKMLPTEEVLNGWKVIVGTRVDAIET